VEKGRIPELIARRIAHSAALCLCVLVAPALLGAPMASASTAVIKGQVSACTSAPPPCPPAAGVLVTLVQGSTALSSSLTSSQGEFILDAPGPGTYTVLGGGSCGEQPEKQVTVVEGQAPEAVALVYPSGDSPFGSCATAPQPSSGAGAGSQGSPSSGSSGTTSKPTSTRGGGTKHQGKHAHSHHKRKKHPRHGRRRGSHRPKRTRR
jgi:hypothetical protein